MNGTRAFIFPVIGLVALFAALGPAVGGVLFVPAVVILRPSIAGEAFAFSALLTSLFGHAILIIPAYGVGLWPAAVTGLFFAAWDAVAPERWPRPLVAAAIGGAVTYALLARFGAVSASVEVAFQNLFGPSSAERLPNMVSAATVDALTHAVVACGAAAGLVCAMAAGLAGLSTRLAPVPPDAAGAA